MAEWNSHVKFWHTPIFNSLVFVILRKHVRFIFHNYCSRFFG
jgi:hypothetical protein